MASVDLENSYSGIEGGGGGGGGRYFGSLVWYRVAKFN